MAFSLERSKANTRMRAFWSPPANSVDFAQNVAQIFALDFRTKFPQAEFKTQKGHMPLLAARVELLRLCFNLDKLSFSDNLVLRVLLFYSMELKINVGQKLHFS